MSYEEIENLIFHTARTEQEVETLKYLNENIEMFAQKLNEAPDSGILGDIIYALKNPSGIFEGRFAQFYRVIDTEKFGILEMLDTCVKLKEVLQDEYISALKECVEDGSIRPNHIVWYINEAAKQVSGKNILEAQMQKLMELTDAPLATLKALEQLECDLTSVEDVCNSRLDAVVSEMLGTTHEDTRELFSRMLQEVLKHEGKRLSDIRKIGEGGYTSAFQIGSKIIKAGEKQEKYKIAKNSKRFLRPLVRHNFDTLESNGTRKTINVEITEAVDTKSITGKDVYEIYKELREEGLVWTDAKTENLGRLLKDNKPHFRKNRACTWT